MTKDAETYFSSVAGKGYYSWKTRDMGFFTLLYEVSQSGDLVQARSAMELRDV